MTTAALTGLLVVLLLVGTALSASSGLHQALHHHDGGKNHVCLICSLVKGLVSAAAAVLIPAVVIFYCLGSVRPAGTPAFSRFDYRLSPSRAPPLS